MLTCGLLVQEMIVYAVFTLLFLGAGIKCAVEAAALDTYYYYTRPNYYGSLSLDIVIVASLIAASVIGILFLTHFFPLVCMQLSKTRQHSYRKEDRAMRPIYGCPEKF